MQMFQNNEQQQPINYISYHSNINLYNENQNLGNVYETL
jgi:hypothetical protein